MSAILERAKAHYGGLPPLDIKIPEWGSGGKAAVITWTKLTVHEQDKIYAPIDGATPGGGAIRIRAVILKACDETGKRLFTDMDEHDLRYKVDGDIVGRIANAILFSAGLLNKVGQALAPEDQVEDGKND